MIEEFPAGTAAPQRTPAATTPEAAAPAGLRAPDGVKPGTVWFWQLAVGTPILALLDLIPLPIYLRELLAGNITDPAAIGAAR